MKMRMIVALIVLSVAVLFARTAQADSTAGYYTTALFDGGYADPVHTWVDLGHGVQLSYYFQNAPSAALPMAAAQRKAMAASAVASDGTGQFGQLVVTGGKKPTNVSETLNLMIHQIGADPSVAVLRGDVAGKVLKHGAAPILMSFESDGGVAQAVIGGTHYTPQNVALTRVGQRVTVTGSVSAVPVPATAGLSLALLGGFAAWQYIGRRRVA